MKNRREAKKEVKMEVAQIIDLFSWCKTQKTKDGKDLLQRARESIIKGMVEAGGYDAYVRQKGYNTEVEITEEMDEKGNKIIYWNCNCPAGRNSNKPCKHTIAKIILMHGHILMQYKNWKEELERMGQEIKRLAEEKMKK